MSDKPDNVIELFSGKPLSEHPKGEHITAVNQMMDSIHAGLHSLANSDFEIDRAMLIVPNGPHDVGMLFLGDFSNAEVSRYMRVVNEKVRGYSEGQILPESVRDVDLDDDC